VLKPGGHVVAFGGTRTYHRLACAIEDAGFEIRDQIADFVMADTFVRQFLESLSDEQCRAFLRCIEESHVGGELSWTFGSGFPKSHNVERGIATSTCKCSGRHFEKTLPKQSERRDGDHVCTPNAESIPWTGWGTAIKPANEPVCLARKPLSEKTVAANVLKWGTGAINIDGCRIDGTGNKTFARDAGDRDRDQYRTGTTVGAALPSDLGRWPANVIHDGSDEVVAALPDSAGQLFAVGPKHGDRGSVNCYGDYGPHPETPPRGDSGSAARFFYSAKAGKGDRLGSGHPTVKPVDLMQYLVRLVTPHGGLVLDPFAGSGTTGEAAFREGMRAILIEREATYVKDIERRISLLLSGSAERSNASVKAKIESGRLKDDAGPLFGGKS
jgi:site-specific DNA-methyltransferase (adenine-specific)